MTKSSKDKTNSNQPHDTSILNFSGTVDVQIRAPLISHMCMQLTQNQRAQS